ncbi:hypothetical protein RO3G_14164 [Rhizopus delemar RA 99-880]|uniref:Peptidase M28 domain-containing protein n=3 Tax=Rhizopus TaxID=4842 RepID=I1CLX3_RHIO9|nr:hypothetical protein RO3G_14164 [Rhizopus delemar RA 99-880]|eukprot:EIE89453.1 hypothetical protein RO3G_14164 [Rhizopus delemar RA 99-880]
MLLSCAMFRTNRLVETEKLIDLMKDLPSTESIHSFFLHYASQSHLAGSPEDHQLAQWTQKQFIHFGIKDSSIQTYYPYLNYPTNRKLAIISGPPELLYEATLKEAKDETIPAFHGYSASGNVTGPILFVNYGRFEDFQLLVSKNITVPGSIALVRHGQIPASLKVKHAEAFKCVGVLVYTDPEEYKHIHDPSMSWDTVVHRDSVLNKYLYPGDPFTAGYGSTHNATRNQTAATNLPSIPSLPISWSDALPLLRATEGHGRVESDWIGGGIKEVGYYTGPSVALCNLVNYNEFKMKPIWNVIGHIKGHQEPNKAIIIGNQRDAWDYGAAAPSSGSAVLLELARVFGILLQKGWQPRRSIILASWDGSEYGNIGSTEWVEDHLEWLDAEAVAYLDVQQAVTGPRFSAQASPMLSRLLVDVTSIVIDPGTSQSVFESWLEQSPESDEEDNTILSLVHPLSVEPGLDTLAFYEHAGISSLSMSFTGNKYAVAHSTFDRISWMEKVGDPLFEYHQTMVRIWGLLTLRLSNDIILPMSPQDYTNSMKQELSKLIVKPEDTCSSGNATFGYPKTSKALEKLIRTTAKFQRKIQGLDHMVVTNKKSKKLLKHINRANARLVLFERMLISPALADKSREWYQHVVYRPSASTGAVQAFPAITAHLDDSDQARLIDRKLSMVLKNAKSALKKGKGKYHISLDEEEEDEDEDDEVTFVE